MTAAEFIDAFNEQNSGVTAGLELKGSNYVIQMKDTKSKSVVNLPASTDCEALGGVGFTASGFDPAATLINTTGDPQTFSYNYLGKTYTVNVGTNFTMNDLVDKINAEAPAGLTAAFDAATGKIAFTATDVLTTTDATFKFRGLDTTGGGEFEVPAGTTLKEFVQLFNKNEYSVEQGYTAALEYDANNAASLVIKDKDGNKLNLYNPADAPGSGDRRALCSRVWTPLPHPTPTGRKALLLLCNPCLWICAPPPPCPALAAGPNWTGRDVVINDTGAEATFSFTDDSGNARTLAVAAGTSMQDFIDAFNAKFNDSASPDNLGIEARAVAMGSGYEIHYFKQGANGEEEVTLTDDRHRRHG